MLLSIYGRYKVTTYSSKGNLLQYSFYHFYRLWFKDFIFICSDVNTSYCMRKETFVLSVSCMSYNFSATLWECDSELVSAWVSDWASRYTQRENTALYCTVFACLLGVTRLHAHIHTTVKSCVCSMSAFLQVDAYSFAIIKRQCPQLR